MGDSTVIDVREPQERMESAIDRLERITRMFEEKLMNRGEGS